MTKKEYKKARGMITDFKFTRGFMWLRLFFTLLAFLLSLVICGMLALEKFTNVNVDTFAEGVIGENLLMVAFLLIYEPISLFSLVYHGAYSAVSLGELMQLDSWDWMSFSNLQYSLAVIGCFILGFILLMISFKALKKTKRNAGGFIWLMLILTVENFICVQRFQLNVASLEVESILVYLIHAINIFSVIMVARSVSCAAYLNKHFEQGTALTKRELKKIYKKGDEE